MHTATLVTGLLRFVEVPVNAVEPTHYTSFKHTVSYGGSHLPS